MHDYLIFFVFRVIIFNITDTCYKDDFSSSFCTKKTDLSEVNSKRRTTLVRAKYQEDMRSFVSNYSLISSSIETYCNLAKGYTFLII